MGTFILGFDQIAKATTDNRQVWHVCVYSIILAAKPLLACDDMIGSHVTRKMFFRCTIRVLFFFAHYLCLRSAAWLDSTEPQSLENQLATFGSVQDLRRWLVNINGLSQIQYIMVKTSSCRFNPGDVKKSSLATVATLRGARSSSGQNLPVLISCCGHLLARGQKQRCPIKLRGQRKHLWPVCFLAVTIFERFCAICDITRGVFFRSACFRCTLCEAGQSKEWLFISGVHWLTGGTRAVVAGKHKN